METKEVKRVSEAQLRAYVAQGLSWPQISAKTGIAVVRLRNAACVLGVAGALKRGRRADGPTDTCGSLSTREIADRVGRGMTLREIGQEAGVSHSAIREHLLSRGLPHCARAYLKAKAAA